MRKFEDYMEGIKDILIKEGLSLVTTVKEPKRLENRATRNGSIQYVVEIAIIVRLFHKSGEWIEIDCYGEGQDSGDKAIYKAITGARQYALACLLGLATTNDPENDEDEKKQAQHQQRPPRQGNTNPPPISNQPLPSSASLEEINKTLSLGVDAI